MVGVDDHGRYSYGNALNDSGEIVGTAQVRNAEEHAFSFTTSEGVVDLGLFRGGHHSEAYGMNDTGQIVGDSSISGGWRAFVYTPSAGMVGLPRLPGQIGSSAAAIDNSTDRRLRNHRQRDVARRHVAAGFARGDEGL